MILVPDSKIWLFFMPKNLQIIVFKMRRSSEDYPVFSGSDFIHRKSDRSSKIESDRVTFIAITWTRLRTSNKEKQCKFF